MKNFLTILSILFCYTVNAASIVYYVAANGNDAANGTSQATAWQTLAKLNTITFAPGDNILFNRGDVFYGSLTINQSGNSLNPITFGAYGTGAKPIITGFTSITSWTNLGSNIWESTNAVSTLSSVSVVTVGNKNIPMGRYPNTGYITYQSNSGNTSITASGLPSSTTNWTGAGIVIRKERWAAENGVITSHVGNTLNYTDDGGWYSPNPNYGCYIQNDARTLDVQNEWYYNPSTKKLRIYSTSTPVGVQASSVYRLVSGSGNYIVFDNLSFQGSNDYCIYLNSQNNITVQNCDIAFTGKEAIYGQSSTYLSVLNNTFNDCGGSAVRLTTNSDNAVIRNNTIKNTGLFVVGVNIFLDGLATDGLNTIIEYNNIDSSGYNGISFSKGGTKIRYNLINHSCLVLDDGGGMYTSSNNVGTEIIGNIILNTVGNATGTSKPTEVEAMGLYFDSNSGSMLIQGNTIAGCGSSGLLISNAQNLTVRDNTLFNNTSASGTFMQGELQIQHIAFNAVGGLDLKNNIFFSTGSSGKPCVFWYYPLGNDVPSFGVADSNYYVRPLNNAAYVTAFTQSAGSIDRNLVNWRTYTSQDNHSSETPKTITDVNDLRLEYNATATLKIVTLPYNYIDVRNVSYNGTITLQPYTSAVLIRNGAIIPPVEPPITKFSIHGNYKVVNK